MNDMQRKVFGSTFKAKVGLEAIHGINHANDFINDLLRNNFLIINRSHHLQQLKRRINYHTCAPILRVVLST